MRTEVTSTYLRQSICLIAGITLLSLLCISVWGDVRRMTVPVCVSSVFQLTACLSYGYVWKRVSLASPASLPTLYLSASAIRMFAGIVTVLAFCFAADSNQSILFFVAIFLIYYFVVLVYDTAYFMKVEKGNRK